MAACEFLVPQIFPCGQWITQAWHPLVIQIAEITGPWGVTALLMMVNGALYDLCDGSEGRADSGDIGRCDPRGRADIRRGSHAAGR